jgi:hypothetical protein
MRKSGLIVPVTALLSGILAAGASAQQAGPSPTKLPPSAGNPLWAISVDRLSATLTRPLFSPSRRPFAPPMVAPLPLPTPPADAGPPPRREPDHPRLTLLGTVVGESVEIGLFVDEASHDVVRLKAGEAHDGWTLHAVSGRAAVFHRDGDGAATLALPAPDPKAHGHTAPPVIQPIAIQGPTFDPGANPAATKGGSRRPPKEG